ncbi:helix-turn-helix domain-containing protein [Nocardia sp. CC227C]|uniref:helix-turn-helix domain-containing protein n=1 Tax=Nocardia sp. CC227C TaxID=3044562 RepID=UPI00278C8C4D|nr:helix-turn-helix domain-containing protein [Nocardia sp. CC227C]
MQTTGEIIRRLRRSVGLTQAELGALLHLTQPAVSQLEHDGPAVHDVRVLRRVANALQVSLATLLPETREEPDVNRRPLFQSGLAAVALSGDGQAAEDPGALRLRVSQPDVDRIVRSINEIHELQLMAGGDQLCALASSQVRYVEQLLDRGTYTDPVGKVLTSAGAEMMTAAGWVHYDAGRWQQAKRYYADAAQAATISGDGVAAAHAWINACLLSYREGSRPKEGVKLAEAAQLAARREGGPKLRALAAVREAEARSVLGDRTGTAAAVSRAQRAYESARGHDPEYLKHLSAAQLSGLSGLAFMRLNDHQTAAAYLNAAIAGSAGFAREQAAWRIRLAQNHVQAGQLTDACTVLTRHFDAVTTVASTRLRTAMENIVESLRPQAAAPEVGEFLGRWMDR